MKPVLLDTGFIVALLDQSERRHAECMAVARELKSPLVTCEAVITESCYLLRNLTGAQDAILRNVEEGIFQVPFQISQSSASVRTILRKYRDIPADFADACLIHLADVLDSGSILTLDGDFRSYRWMRNRNFDLVIEP